jgi:hypothetical protein
VEKIVMENQNLQPDYNFIMNQPGTGPPARPPKMRKKLIVGGIIGLLVITLLAALVVVANQSANKSAQVAPAASQTLPTSNPVEVFLAALKQQDYRTATILLPGTQDDPASAVDNLKQSFSAINLDSCQVSPMQGNKVTSYSDLTCRRQDNKYGEKIEFQISQDGGDPVILSYKVEVVS